MSENTNVSPLDEQAINQEIEEGCASFSAAMTLDDLKEAKIKHLGDNSIVVNANKQIGKLDPADKAKAGKIMGQARQKLNASYNENLQRVQELAELKMLEDEKVDVTVDLRRRNIGGRHPLTVLMEEVSDFFTSYGWQIAEGPEIEHEWFNFDALNFDIDHPARQMQDTFYIDPASVGNGKAEESNLVMRTHTSPVQARTMLEKQPPIYIACPGKVFRSDELDATHTPVFHQVEGLAIDKGLTMANLKGTLDAFAKAMFGPEAKTRLRPSFFPFTEPSAEMDLWFPQKKGGPGWIEWGGCGMVNPNVLKACGIDPEIYTGFAFGMGIERTLMLRHGINDMHDIVEGDIRFTHQFSTAKEGR